MSLGAWIRDYVYIPLGGSREGELKRTRNVMLAMLFTGLWHGMGWTFLVWGGLHGVLLAVNHWWRRHGVKLPAVIAWALTFGSVVMLWVVFRSESLSQAGKIFAAMMDFGNIGLPLGYGIYIGFLRKIGISFVPFVMNGSGFAINSVYAFVLLVLCLAAPNSRQIAERFRPGKFWAAVVVVMAVMSFMNFSGITDFLYFQF